MYISYPNSRTNYKQKTFKVKTFRKRNTNRTNTPYRDIYDDGTVEKRIVIE